MVRPWALLGPVLILLICLPMLRPLRHPTQVSTDELLTLLTVQSIVENDAAALPQQWAMAIPTDRRVVTEHGTYAAQPPMLAVLLSVPAETMDRLGVGFDEHPTLVAYVLTLLCSTIPAALAAGFVYRMGRMFELRRRWRALLGLVVVAGSGLLSYAVVINPHVPAAVLVLGAATCLVHITRSPKVLRSFGFFFIAGACALLAATLDPLALLPAILLVAVIATFRMPAWHRTAGVALYVVGALLPLLVHWTWNHPISGSIWPAGPQTQAVLMALAPAGTEIIAATDSDLLEPASVTTFGMLASWIGWLWLAMFGSHGLLSHFPVLLLGVIGIGAVMHRHWPVHTKVLAGATAASAIGTLLYFMAQRLDFSDAMFANRYFVVFLPLLLVWAGAWLRRTHGKASWVLAGLLVAFTMVVALVGMTNPYPPHGYNRYTAFQALERIVQPDVAPVDARAIAGTFIYDAR
jgi:hypothetical protein